MNRLLLTLGLLAAAALPGWAQKWQPLSLGMRYVHSGFMSSDNAPNFVAADSAGADSAYIYLNADWRQVSLDTGSGPVAPGYLYQKRRSNYLGMGCYRRPDSSWVYEVEMLGQVTSIPVSGGWQAGGTYASGAVAMRVIAKTAETVEGQPDSVLTWELRGALPSYNLEVQTVRFSKGAGILQFPTSVRDTLGGLHEFGFVPSQRRIVYRRVLQGQGNPLPVHALEWVTATVGARVTLTGQHGYAAPGLGTLRTALAITVRRLEIVSGDRIRVIGAGQAQSQLFNDANTLPRDSARVTTADSLAYEVWTPFVDINPQGGWAAMQAGYYDLAAPPVGIFSYFPTGNYRTDPASGRTLRIYQPARIFTYQGVPYMHLADSGGAGYSRLKLVQGAGMALLDRRQTGGERPPYDHQELACFAQAGPVGSCPSVSTYAVPFSAAGRGWQPLAFGTTYLHKGTGNGLHDGPNYVVADSGNDDGTEVYLSRAWRQMPVDTGAGPMSYTYQRVRYNHLGTRCNKEDDNIWTYTFHVNGVKVPIPVSGQWRVGDIYDIRPFALTVTGKAAERVLGRLDSTLTWQITSSEPGFDPQVVVFSKQGGIVQFPTSLNRADGVPDEIFELYTRNRRVYQQLRPGQTNLLPIHAQAWTDALAGAHFNQQGYDYSDTAGFKAATSLTVDSVLNYTADSVRLYAHGSGGFQPTNGRGIPIDTARYADGYQVSYPVVTRFTENPDGDAWHLMQADFAEAAGNPTGRFSFFPAGNYFPSAESGGLLRRSYALAWPFVHDSTLYLRILDPTFEGQREMTFAQGTGQGRDFRSFMTGDQGLLEVSCYTPADDADTCASIRQYFAATRPAVSETAARVAPNPFHSTLTLAAAGPFRYELRSVDGRLYLAGSSTAKEATVQTDKLPPGLYQAFVYTGKGKPVALRIVKQ